MRVAALACGHTLHRILHRLGEMLIGRLQVMLRRDGHTVADPSAGDVCGEPVGTRAFHEIQVAAKARLEIDNCSHGYFHDLRKTFATRAAANGVPMHELQPPRFRSEK